MLQVPLLVSPNVDLPMRCTFDSASNTYTCDGSRTYKASPDTKTWTDARDWCTSQNLGLVVWDTEDVYEDVKFIAFLRRSDVYTALYNFLRQSCSTSSSCNDKLVK